MVGIAPQICDHIDGARSTDGAAAPLRPPAEPLLHQITPVATTRTAAPASARLPNIHRPFS
jgi:hypothetical protein